MHRRWLLAVFVLAAAVRCYNLNVPFVEPFNSISRLSICGSVARNFYTNGFNFFYPEIDENGPGPYLLNAEMPTNTYLAALAYWLTGGVHEWAARAVSVAFSMGGLWLLYLLLRRIGNERIALFGTLFAALSPMNVALARSTQCDTTMVFFGLSAIYLFYRYYETGRNFYFWTSALSLFLAVGTKIYSLYLFIPVFYLGWKKDGVLPLLKPKNYLYATLATLSLAWYFYMREAGKGGDLAYPVYILPDKILQEPWWFVKIFFSPAYLKLPAKAFLLHLATPLGFLCLAAGLSVKAFRSYPFAGVWLISALIYLFLTWPTAVIHPYYMLSLIPPLAFFVGLGADRLLSGKRSGPILRNPLVMTLLVCLEAASVLYYYRLLYFIPKDRMAIVEAGKTVDASIPRTALVIASYGYSPIQLYYSNRKGWSFNLDRNDDEALIDEFEGLVARGGTYFVTTRLEELHRLPKFEAYLRSGHRPVEENEDFVIFKLGEAVHV